MSKLLIDEPPLQVLPSLACRIGLEESIFLQQLHYWLRKSNHIRNEHRWVHNTYEGWQKQFPFWSTKTVQRIILSLQRSGLIICNCFNQSRMDKTKWYTINYEKLKNAEKSDHPKRDDDEVKLTSSSGQFEVMHEDRLSSSIIIETETTQETTTETTTSPVVVPNENEDDDRKIDDINDIIAGTKFQDVISKNAIKEAIDSYRPEAHINYQPETPAEGLHRILGWMSHIEMSKIENPSGFLIDMARKGMGKPAALIRAEQTAQAKRQESEKRKREREELEAIKSEREIPQESREFLDRLRGRVSV